MQGSAVASVTDEPHGHAALCRPLDRLATLPLLCRRNAVRDEELLQLGEHLLRQSDWIVGSAIVGQIPHDGAHHPDTDNP